MERTEHVLLAADGANQFATEMNVEHAPDEYFYTEHRWQQLQDAIAAGRIQLDHALDSTSFEGGVATPSADGVVLSDAVSKPIGTVGAVACDSEGHVAAATSTGGMTNKKFGRVGDTPIIGSGNYADDRVAVSCTGHGEYFMLGVTAYDVAARIKYKGLSLEDAAAETIARLTEIGGEGGLIAVDSEGNVVLPFNSDGMYRGSVSANGDFHIEIYR